MALHLALAAAFLGEGLALYPLYLALDEAFLAEGFLLYSLLNHQPSVWHNAVDQLVRNLVSMTTVICFFFFIFVNLQN